METNNHHSCLEKNKMQTSTHRPKLPSEKLESKVVKALEVGESSLTTLGFFSRPQVSFCEHLFRQKSEKLVPSTHNTDILITGL